MVQTHDALVETPTTYDDAADAMRSLAGAGIALRPRGSSTKFDWGGICEHGAVVSTGGLSEIVEHNAKDLTVVLQAGVALADAQRALAEENQMLALDPPRGATGDATIGGILATGDSGPLRHRYRAARDLVLGMTVALSDGTLARSGGKVIKNVAGYDLPKLFTGSFGTLGLILEVVLRLHPKPERTTSVVGFTDRAESLQSCALAMAHAALEIEALDVAWEDGRGKVLARFGGAAPGGQAPAATAVVREAGLEPSVHDDDEGLWEAQRDAQRGGDVTIVKVAALPTDLLEVVGAAEEADASLVGRGALGLYWLRLARQEPGRAAEAIRSLRDRLAPRACTVLDASPAVRAEVGPWPQVEGPALDLMRSVKARFDPTGVCSPGVFVGGI